MYAVLARERKAIREPRSSVPANRNVTRSSQRAMGGGGGEAFLVALSATRLCLFSASPSRTTTGPAAMWTRVFLDVDLPSVPDGRLGATLSLSVCLLHPMLGNFHPRRIPREEVCSCSFFFVFFSNQTLSLGTGREGCTNRVQKHGAWTACGSG